MVMHGAHSDGFVDKPALGFDLPTFAIRKYGANFWVCVGAGAAAAFTTAALVNNRLATLATILGGAAFSGKGFRMFLSDRRQRWRAFDANGSR
ncbi:Hypothetical protein HDN1F_34300 [gamma proteobacterium HdN1]|nr:Hypothetical protein HDN1F_34300 [gamma proteobacterium HdN1]